MPRDRGGRGEDEESGFREIGGDKKEGDKKMGWAGGQGRLGGVHE